MTPDGEIFRFAENNIVLPPEFQDTKGYAGDFSGSEASHLRAQERQLAVRQRPEPGRLPITGPWRQGAL